MKFKVSPSVVSRQVGDEIMLMDLQSGTYFGLDPMGAEVFRAIESGVDPESLGAEWADKYDASTDQIAADVTGFVETLRDKGLILSADD